MLDCFNERTGVYTNAGDMNQTKDTPHVSTLAPMLDRRIPALESTASK